MKTGERERTQPGAWTEDWRGHSLALGILALAILVVYGNVLFTNRAPASGDFLYYFVPYWDYVNEALATPRLPLWNPYLFAGAPLLANPQVQIFYPLRWLFIPFSAEKGILYFAALHAWLAGAFTYGLARRVLRVGLLGGFTAGLLFALNGWVTGLLPHPGQWGAIPWLPAALLLWEMRPHTGGRAGLSQRPVRLWLVALVLVWTLTLLAGHSQMFYNQAVIFGVWVLITALWQAARKTPGPLPAKLRTWNFVLAVWAELRLSVLLLILIFALTLTLSAVQTLPTLELTTQSYRSGGLPFRDHAALSLPPWRLGFTLLPHYARNLGQALASEAYSEWLAYAGLLGLLLAGIGLGRGRGRLRFLAGFLLLGGVFLAFGAYNPFSYLLYRLVPGWNLFRAPARWLEASVLGLALLAALGVEELWMGWRPARFRFRRPLAWLVGSAAILLALTLVILTRPNALTLAGWGGALLAMLGVLRARGRMRRWGTGLLVGLLFLELYAASWGLPIQHPTAPQALRSWRTAPARIAAEARPDCRTLSLSTLTYDPGDLADLKRIYGPFLDEQAFTDLVVATKSKEILAPNLGLLFRLPSLDGFGGGVLPTRHFVESMGLFLPPDQIVADGRLREQLRQTPDARLLSLLGVCYVITDKTFDVWHDNVYYDLAFGEALTAAQPDLTLTSLPQFPATRIGLVSHLQGGSYLRDGAVVAELVAVSADGVETRWPIRAGIDTAEGADDSPGLAHNRELPHVRWRFEAPGQDAITTFSLPSPQRLVRLSLHLLDPEVTLFVRGAALVDDVSGAHATPLVSRHPWRRIHSGDVKIYRNEGVMPRASLIPAAEVSPDDAATLTRMLSPSFDPRQTVLLAEGEPATGGGAGSATLFAESPERLIVQVQATGPATLLVANAWYPGWRATVDGQPVPLYRADLLLQAAPVPAGQHEVVLTFAPSSLRWGASISLVTLALLLLHLLWPSQDLAKQ